MVAPVCSVRLPRSLHELLVEPIRPSDHCSGLPIALHACRVGCDLLRAANDRVRGQEPGRLSRTYLGTRHAQAANEARVRSTRGAVLASRPVRFPEPPPAPDMRLSTHPALHKPRVTMRSHAPAGHGDGIFVPRYR